MSSLARFSSSSVNGRVFRPAISSRASLGSFHGGGALRQHFYPEHGGMVIGECVPTPHGVGQPSFGADLLKEPAGEASAQDVVHHRQRRDFRIVAVRAQAHDLHIRLVHVFLVDEVDRLLGLVERIVARGRRAWPAAGSQMRREAELPWRQGRNRR